MVRCGYVNPSASGQIAHAIEEKLREFERRPLDYSPSHTVEAMAEDLTSEIKRILEVECDIGWIE